MNSRKIGLTVAGIFLVLTAIWEWFMYQNMLRFVLGICIAVFAPLTIYRRLETGSRKYEIILIILIGGAFLVTIDRLILSSIMIALGCIWFLGKEIKRSRR